MTPRFFIAALVLTVLLSPKSLLANKIYFPQVAFGGGYTTDFAVINTGATTVSAPVLFYGQDGSARPDLTTPIVVTPGSTVRFTLPDNGPLTVVWAELDAGSGSVQGVATFSLRVNGVLTTTAGILGTSSGNSFLIPVDVTASGATGVAVANLHDSSAINVTLRLINENGTPFATAADVRFLPMQARGQVAAFVNEIFPQLAGTTFKGSLIIEDSTNASSLTATALTVKEGILSSLPVLPGDGTGGTKTLYFPQVAFGGGYTTTFTIMNTGATPIASTVNFYDQAGNNRPDLSSPVNIPAGGSNRFSIPDNGDLTVVWGELLLPSGSAQGVATFDLRDGNGNLATTVGVLGVEADTSVLLPADESTGVAVANLSDNSVKVTLRLLKSDGAEIAQANDARFNPMTARSQVAVFVTELFPQIVGTSFAGSLVIEQSAANAITAAKTKTGVSYLETASLAATALTLTEGIFSSLPVITGGKSTGGEVIGGGPASACINPDLYNGRFTVQLAYNIRGAASGTQVFDWVARPNVEFMGYSTTEWEGTQRTMLSGQPDTTFSTRHYSTLEGLEVLQYGSILEMTSPTSSSTTAVFKPPRRDRRYALNPGESATTSYELTTTVRTPGAPPPLDVTTTTTQVTDIIRYLGQESITVPAGTFDTCKFEEQNGEFFSWFAFGTGVMVRSEGTDGIMELTSGALNGSPIN